MQAVVLCGRSIARAVLAGINNENVQNKLAWKNAQSTRTEKGLHLISASSGLSKIHSCAQVITKWSFGDDACFVAGHPKADVLGVADGVGGWRSYGVDPAVFPVSLMQTCERMVRDGNFLPHDPVNIISSGYYELLETKSSILGSCTACVVSLVRQDNTLYAANLGDSGFLVIRSGKVLLRSEEQQHYFNTPFQLSMAPMQLEGVVLSDRPETARRASIGVKEGDIILVGTDGLFDNLSEEMILHHVAEIKDDQPDVIQKVANKIAHVAHELSFDPDYMSPFAFSAAANGFGNVQGGKPDDITVVLARVSEYTLEDT